MPTPPAEMTDLQLDLTLEHCYRQHRDATLGRRAIIHKVIVDVLAEQKTRRDEWLRAGDYSRNLTGLPATTASA